MYHLLDCITYFNYIFANTIKFKRFLIVFSLLLGVAIKFKRFLIVFRLVLRLAINFDLGKQKAPESSGALS